MHEPIALSPGKVISLSAVAAVTVHNIRKLQRIFRIFLYLFNKICCIQGLIRRHFQWAWNLTINEWYSGLLVYSGAIALTCIKTIRVFTRFNLVSSMRI
jgi:hypothetical protein